MEPAGRTGRRGVAALAIAACLAVPAGCGGGSQADTSARSASSLREALSSGACPPRNLVLRAGKRYSREVVRQARGRSLFRVHEVDRRLEPPVDWRQDPYDSKAFRGRLADLDWTEVLFFSYREHDDLGALRQARDLILDWIRNQPRGGARTTEEAWKDKVTGDRVLHLAYLARAGACEEILLPGQLDLLARSIAEHAALLTDADVYRPTNHGLYMDLSLVLLSEQLRSPRSEHWRELALERYADTFASRVVEDEGMWLEHSAGYQVLLTKLLAKSLETPGFSLPGGAELLERMREVTAWLVMPDGGIPQFGHSDAARAPSFARRRARESTGLLTLLDSGLAVVREPGSYLSVVAGFHNTSHKQADELSFDLFERGLRVISDSGLYHKDRDRFYAFATSPAAHSSLSVDGKGFPLSDGHAYGSGLLATGEGEGWYAILGRNPLLRDVGVDHRRLFLYRPGEALLVADRVRADKPHTYRRHFQFGPDARLSRPRDAARPGSGAGVKVLTLRGPRLDGTLTSVWSGGHDRVTAVRGRNRPLTGFAFPGFRERVPRWTVSFASKTTDANYVGTFDIDGGKRLQAWPSELMARQWRLDLYERGSRPFRLEVSREGERLYVRTSRIAGW